MQEDVGEAMMMIRQRISFYEQQFYAQIPLDEHLVRMDISPSSSSSSATDAFVDIITCIWMFDHLVDTSVTWSDLHEWTTTTSSSECMQFFDCYIDQVNLAFKELAPQCEFLAASEYARRRVRAFRRLLPLVFAAGSLQSDDVLFIAVGAALLGLTSRAVVVGTSRDNAVLMAALVATKLHTCGLVDSAMICNSEFDNEQHISELLAVFHAVDEQDDRGSSFFAARELLSVHLENRLTFAKIQRIFQKLSRPCLIFWHYVIEVDINNGEQRLHTTHRALCDELSRRYRKEGQQ